MSASEGYPFSSAMDPAVTETAPMKVLMIEDDAKDFILIQQMLASQKEVEFELEHATTFSKGVKYLSGQSTDVVLLDLSLPDAKGPEMFERLHREAPSVPVVVLTGTDDPQLALYMMSQGAQDYLVKGSVNSSLLLRSMRYAMERQHLLVQLEQKSRDIVERKKAEDQIKAALKEKDVLLKEIHHRVKNNLQIISSLLRLQSGSGKDKKGAEVFKDSQNRIKAMALIHEILYQSENLNKINFADYIRKLADGLFRSYGVKSNAIALDVRADDVLLDLDAAIPCGLIVNELVSNSIKYAFPNNAHGKIWIHFLRDPKQKSVALTVGDNGVGGIPKDLDINHIESLGLRLVSTLTDQLGAKLEQHFERGTKFKVIFSLAGE